MVALPEVSFVAPNWALNKLSLSSTVSDYMFPVQQRAYYIAEAKEDSKE